MVSASISSLIALFSYAGASRLKSCGSYPAEQMPAIPINRHVKSVRKSQAIGATRPAPRRAILYELTV
jgi:hypothetical protein